MLKNNPGNLVNNPLGIQYHYQHESKNNVTKIMTIPDKCYSNPHKSDDGFTSPRTTSHKSHDNPTKTSR